MSQTSAEMIYQRVAIVDEVMRKKGWNVGVVNELALTLGCDRRAVYRLRNMAISWTRKHLRPTDIAAWRTQQVQALADISNEARENGDYGAAVRAIRTQAEILGTIAPTKVDVTSTTRLDVSPAVVDLVSQRLALASTPRPTVIEAEAEVLSVVSAGE